MKTIAEIDLAELAVRMCEASYGLKRPDGATGLEALHAMDDECRAGWTRAAMAAMRYLEECLSRAKTNN